VKKALAAIFVLALAGPSLTAQSKKVLTLADYGQWKRITSTVMSDDGKWVSYTYSPNDGDDTLTIRQFDGPASYTVTSGSGAAGRGGRGGGGGGGVQFSSDSHYAAYFVNPPAAAGRGRGAARAGRRFQRLQRSNGAN
jgi:hypothetical protein